ncbi:MAG: hypothetical protein V3T58_01450 [Candidatus Hydrothermarchaeales archaeon]
MDEEVFGVIIEIKKSLKKEEVISHLENKYGSFEKLGDMVKKGCESPEAVDDYEVWKAVREGKEYEESIRVEEAGVLTVLTPKRIELLEYLKRKHPRSIKELSKRLGRDYKNVYGDLKLLSDYNVVERLEKKRNIVPTCHVKEIIVSF